MDRKDWGWLAQHMPLTVAQLKEYRDAGEGAHIDECWRRGVLGGEPGWLFAREGAVSVGTPFYRDQVGGDVAVKHGQVLQLAPMAGAGIDQPAPVPRSRAQLACFWTRWARDGVWTE